MFKIFYVDVKFKDDPSITEVIIVANTEYAARDGVKEMVKEMVKDPPSIDTIRITNTFSLMNLPVVLETAMAKSHIDKIKFTGLRLRKV